MWTTEQVADYLSLTAQDVYESRRRGAYPGNLGIRRGRKLLFPSDQVMNPPEEQATSDPTTAILWALDGIHKTLRAIHNELRAQRAWPLLDITDEITTAISYQGTGEEE